MEYNFDKTSYKNESFWWGKDEVEKRVDCMLTETGSSGNRFGYKKLIRRYVDQLSIRSQNT